VCPRSPGVSPVSVCVPGFRVCPRFPCVSPVSVCPRFPEYNGELIIRSVNKSLGTARGGDEVFLLCEKVDKDDIEVRLFEEENGEVVWESYGELDVHREYAIVFKTPKYKDVYITKPVRVNLQLMRPSDGETSDPVLFTYMPEVFETKTGLEPAMASTIIVKQESAGTTDYDAFVSYRAEGEDLQFVIEMREKLAQEPYNLRLYVPLREASDGASSRILDTAMLERCNRVVVVLSPEYLKSSEFEWMRQNVLDVPQEVRMSLTPVVATPCEIPECLYGYPVIHLIRERATEVAWQRFASYFKPLEKRRGFNRQTMDTHSTSTKRSSQNVLRMHYPAVHDRKRGNTMTYSQQGEMTAESPLDLSFSKGRSEDALERHLCVTCGRKYASQSSLRIHQKLCYLDHGVQQSASSLLEDSLLEDSLRGPYAAYYRVPFTKKTQGNLPFFGILETPMLKGYEASVTTLCKSENVKEESGDMFFEAAETHALEGLYHALTVERILRSDDAPAFSDAAAMKRKVLTGVSQSNKSYTRADEKDVSESASKLGMKQESYTFPLLDGDTDLFEDLSRSTKSPGSDAPLVPPGFVKQEERVTEDDILKGVVNLITQGKIKGYAAASMPMADTKAKSTTYKQEQPDEMQMFQQDPLLRQTRNPSLIPPSGCLRRSHSSVHELSWEKLETRVAEKKEDAGLSREPDNEVQPAASPDLSDSDPSVPQPVFCDKWEACEEFGSDGGLLHCDDSDVVLEIPENSIKASQQISIRAAVSTDLQTIHKRLDLSEDEMIMSPVPEFDAGDNFEFEKPVVVILPHFIPTVDRPDVLNVYKFHLYDSDMLHFEKLRQAPVHESITKQEAHCGVFVLSTPQTIHIVTSHFTGFFCTLCNKQVVPRPLRLRLYGRHIQRDTQEVDIWLFVGDTRLDIRDFRKAVLRRKDEVHFLTNQSIDPWSDDSEDVKLGVRLVISESERAQWQHREIGGRVLPAERKVNVKQFRPCNICSDPCPTKVTWSVVSSPGSFPSRWFNSFIEAGFCRSEGAAVQFLVGHGQNCLDIIGLELQNEKKSATSQTELVSEKSHVTELASTSPPSSQTKLQWATEFPSVKQQKATSAGEQATPGNQAQGGYQPLTSHASSSTRTDTDENTLPHFQELDAERYTQTTTYPAGNVAAMSSEGNGEQGGVNELGLPAPTSSATNYHSAEARHMTPEGSGTHDPSTSCNSLVDIFIPKARRQGSGSQGPSVYTFHAHINKFYHTNNSSVTMPTNKAQTVTFNVSSNPPDRNEGGDGQTERKSLSDTKLPVSLDPVSSGSTPSLLSQQNSNSFEQSVTEKPEKAHHQAAKSSAVEKQEDGSNPSTSKDGQGGEEAVGPASSVFKLSQGKLETMKDDKGELGVEPTGSCSPANKKSVLKLPARATKNGKPLLACLVAEEFVEEGVGRGDSKSAKQKEHGHLGYLAGEDFVERGVGCISTKQEEREHDTSKMPEVGDAVSENASVLPTPPGDHSKSRLTGKSSKNGLNGTPRESPSPPHSGNTEGDQPTPVLRASQKLRGRKTKGKDETSMTKDQESQDHTRSMRSRGNGAPDNPRKRSNDLVLTRGKKPRMAKV
ncbi:hypothetical protein BaRGS_00038075, partial [Batillaria attramentaria]